MSLLLTARPRASGDTYLMARQHILWPYMATATSGSWSLTADSSSLHRGYTASPNGTIGHYLEWADVALSPGDYLIQAISYHGSGYGIYHVSHGGVDTGARLDTYAGGGGYNQISSDTFTVATKARGALRVALDSKNASGSGYNGALVVIVISKTSTGTDEGATVDDLPWIVDVDVLALSSSSSGWAYDMGSYYRGTDLYSDGASGRWVEFQAWLPAGTWKLTEAGYRGASQGIADITLDGGSVVGQIDNYGSAGYMKLPAATGIVVPTTKIYTVRLTATSKNASSGGYALYIDNLEFRRTS